MDKKLAVAGVVTLGTILGLIIGSRMISHATSQHPTSISRTHSVSTSQSSITIINPSNSTTVRIVYNNTHVDLKPSTQTTIPRPQTNIIVDVLVYRNGLWIPFYCYTISPPFPNTITIDANKVNQCYVNVSRLHLPYPQAVVTSSHAIWV